MTSDDIESITDGLAPVLRELFQKRDTRIAQLEHRVLQQEAEIVELRARPVVKEFRGTWLADVTYEKGDRVSAAGGSWIALMDSRGRKPSETASCWFLEVRSGRDGRDGRDLK